MADASGIRAARAYVEIGAVSTLNKDLSAAEARVRTYTKRVVELQAKADFASKSGNTVAASRLTALVSGMAERRETAIAEVEARKRLALKMQAARQERDMRIAIAREVEAVELKTFQQQYGSSGAAMSGGGGPGMGRYAKLAGSLGKATKVAGNALMFVDDPTGKLFKIVAASEMGSAAFMRLAASGQKVGLSLATIGSFAVPLATLAAVVAVVGGGYYAMYRYVEGYKERLAKANDEGERFIRLAQAGNKVLRPDEKKGQIATEAQAAIDANEKRIKQIDRKLGLKDRDESQTKDREAQRTYLKEQNTKLRALQEEEAGVQKVTAGYDDWKDSVAAIYGSKDSNNVNVLQEQLDWLRKVQSANEAAYKNTGRSEFKDAASKARIEAVDVQNRQNQIIDRDVADRQEQIRKAAEKAGEAQKKAAEKAAEANKKFAASLVDVQTKLAAMNSGKSDFEQQLDAEAKKMLSEGISASKVVQYKNISRQLETAGQNRRLGEQTRDAQDAADLASGRKTRDQLERERLRRENPNASASVIDRLVKAGNAQRSAEWVKGEKESLLSRTDPMFEMRKYAENLDAGLTSGQLTHQQALVLRGSKAAEMLAAGQTSRAAFGGESIRSLQSGTADRTAKATEQAAEYLSWLANAAKAGQLALTYQD